MTPDMATHYIELGHIAHKGLPMAWMEFGAGGTKERYLYESVREYADSEYEALVGLVRSIKLNPKLKGQHLFWRKLPSTLEENGKWEASARLMCVDRCDVSFDALLEPGGSLSFEEAKSRHLQVVI